MKRKEQQAEKGYSEHRSVTTVVAAPWAWLARDGHGRRVVVRPGFMHPLFSQLPELVSGIGPAYKRRRGDPHGALGAGTDRVLTVETDPERSVAMRLMVAETQTAVLARRDATLAAVARLRLPTAAMNDPSLHYDSAVLVPALAIVPRKLLPDAPTGDGRAQWAARSLERLRVESTRDEDAFLFPGRETVPAPEAASRAQEAQRLSAYVRDVRAAWAALLDVRGPSVVEEAGGVVRAPLVLHFGVTPLFVPLFQRERGEFEAVMADCSSGHPATWKAFNGGLGEEGIEGMGDRIREHYAIPWALVVEFFAPGREEALASEVARLLRLRPGSRACLAVWQFCTGSHAGRHLLGLAKRRPREPNAWNYVTTASNRGWRLGTFVPLWFLPAVLYAINNVHRERDPVLPVVATAVRALIQTWELSNVTHPFQAAAVMAATRFTLLFETLCAGASVDAGLTAAAFAHGSRGDLDRLSARIAAAEAERARARAAAAEASARIDQLEAQIGGMHAAVDRLEARLARAAPPGPVAGGFPPRSASFKFPGVD